MKNKDWLFLALSVAVCEAVGMLGGLFTAPAIPVWYAGLHKAALNPPSWVFAPVWTLLYALMGVAAFLACRRGSDTRAVRLGNAFFSVQLALNFLWSVLFFGLRLPGLAFLEIVILWLTILATIIFYSRANRAAGWLLVPYLLWVSFASYLNLSVWLLN